MEVGEKPKTMNIKYIIYIFLQKITNIFKPKNIKEINFINNLRKNGYSVKMQNKLLKITDVRLNENHFFWLRRFSSDPNVFNQIMIKEEYLSLIDIIRRKNKEKDIKLILDLGANIGLASIFFHRFFKDAKIIAIEPDEDNFKYLQINTKKIEQINSKKKAIWVRETSLYINNDFRDGREWSKSVSDNPKGQLVETITFSEILSEFPDLNIDILKIDIEGTERELFLDDKIDEILRKVKFFAIEIHDEFDSRQLICNKLSEINCYWTNHGELTIGYNLNNINK